MTALPVPPLWSVYLIACENGALYCGISTDVARRWRQHLAGKGAKYTRMHKPVAIKIVLDALSETAARQAEYRIKQLNAAQKRCAWQHAPPFAER